MKENCKKNGIKYVATSENENSNEKHNRTRKLKRTLVDMGKGAAVKCKKDNISFKAVLPCGKTVNIQYQKDPISNNSIKNEEHTKDYP